MDRCFQVLLMISTAGLSWLLMMLLHECGHVWHGWLSGATLEGIHLPLLGFSRTEFAANPHPLFVAWGGPVWGCIFPLGIWAGLYAFIHCGLTGKKRKGTEAIVGISEQKGTEEVVGINPSIMESLFPKTSSVPLSAVPLGLDFLPRWFTGFCLIANGAYLLGGVFPTDGADDGGVILQHGGSIWQLSVFGIAALAAGLYLWNGLAAISGSGQAEARSIAKRPSASQYHGS